MSSARETSEFAQTNRVFALPADGHSKPVPKIPSFDLPRRGQIEKVKTSLVPAWLQDSSQ